MIRSGRAYGKAILLGEHAVVYGAPAIAIGLEPGATAEVTFGGGASRLSFEASALSGTGIELLATDTCDLATALRALLAASNVTEPVHARVKTQLPPGGGLGCSAAVGVAIARALDPIADTSTVERRADAWERVFHGNPSGVDAAIAARGGSILFRRGLAPTPLKSPSPLHLVIGYTGKPASTKAMVESVARLRDRRPDVVEKAFGGIDALVRNAKLALEAGDVTGLGRLMDLNQMILSGLFLSTPEIEALCDAARGAGAFGAKLTGGGGGGSVIALAASTEASRGILAAWMRAGYTGFATATLAAEPTATTPAASAI